MANNIQTLIEELSDNLERGENQRDDLIVVVADVRDSLDTLVRDSGKLLRLNKKLVKSNAESHRLEKASNLQNMEDKLESKATPKSGKGGGFGGSFLAGKAGLFNKMLDGETIGRSIKDGMAIATGMSLTSAIKDSVGPKAMKLAGKSVLAAVGLAIMEGGKRLGDTFAKSVRDATGDAEAGMAADLATGAAAGYAAGSLVFRKFKFLRVIPAIGGMWYNMLEESEKGAIENATGWFDKATALIKAVPKTDFSTLDVSPVTAAMSGFGKEIAVMGSVGALSVISNMKNNVAKGIRGAGIVKGATGGIMTKMLGFRTMLGAWAVSEHDSIANWIGERTGSSTLGDIGSLAVVGGTLGSTFGPVGALVGALAGFAAGGAVSIANYIRGKAKSIDDGIRISAEGKLKAFEEQLKEAESKLTSAKESGTVEQVEQAKEVVGKLKEKALDTQLVLGRERQRQQELGHNTVQTEKNALQKYRDQYANEDSGVVRSELQRRIADTIKEINKQTTKPDEYINLSEQDMSQLIFDLSTKGGTEMKYAERRRMMIPDLFKKNSDNYSLFNKLRHGDESILDMKMNDISAIKKSPTKINEAKIQSGAGTRMGNTVVDASTNIVNNNGGGDGNSAGVVESSNPPVTNPSFNYGGMF